MRSAPKSPSGLWINFPRPQPAPLTSLPSGRNHTAPPLPPPPGRGCSAPPYLLLSAAPSAMLAFQRGGSELSATASGERPYRRRLDRMHGFAPTTPPGTAATARRAGTAEASAVGQAIMIGRA